jgi:alpha-mannosidase
MGLDAHIVSHTHWDREWYHPVERFQQRLVELVDELLDDPPRAHESFLLDGQAIVVEDYLSIRPDRAAEIAQLLSDGRLEAGPWYVLADELIPSGEAIVRNLFAGRRALRRFNATIPSVLYCPDSFGHPATLPSIAAGFGLPVVVLWRGYGSRRWPNADTVKWSAPNGDAAILYHLPRDGYEFGSNLPADSEQASARWKRMRAELAPRSSTGVVLITNGADHHARQENLDASIDSLIRAVRATGDSAHASSLQQFANALLAASAEKDLAAVRGELRDSYGYTWTIQGTFGTRAAEKRANARAERLLVREAEPWAALASLRGTDMRPLVESAWRTLLAAHPHDTLCGCSIDDVAVAMELRVRSARNQGRGIRDDAIAQVIGHDACAARTAKDSWIPSVIVRNPAARCRSGVAIIEVEEFIADVRVGPGSATAVLREAEGKRRRPRVAGLGSLQVLSTRVEHSLTESPRHYPDADLVSVATVAAWVTDIGGYSVVSHEIGAGPRGSAAPGKVVTSKTEMSNSAIATTVNAHGHVSVEELGRGRRIDSLIDFIDEDDAGDLYTPSPRPRAITVKYRGCKRTHRGPLRGELSLRYDLIAPHPRRHTTATIVVNLILDAGTSFVRVNVRGKNHDKNHRIRLVLRTDVVPGETWADAAFGPLRRERIVITPDEEKVEASPPTAPLHRYVSLFSSSFGATVFSDGLAEYESRDDGSILVTLVRAVGELSRNDIPERPGHAGWPRSTPAAQCLGPFAGDFAILLHGGRSKETIDQIERTADDVLSPIVGTTLRSALVVSPPTPGVELRGVGLAFSAIKQSEDGEWLVLRCVNLCDEPLGGEWALPFDIHEARQSRLDETPTSHIVFAGREVPIVAAPRDIVTILVR